MQMGKKADEYSVYSSDLFAHFIDKNVFLQQLE